MIPLALVSCTGSGMPGDPADAAASDAWDDIRDRDAGILQIMLPDLPPAVCGDGYRSPGLLGLYEACDDGNTVSGDGCSSACYVERGWICPKAGQPCVPPPSMACGDGFLAPYKACDDGNSVDGDGCSADCRQVEPGWRCPAAGRPCVRLCDGGVCSGAVCGNGIVEPGEDCDDGNDPGRVPHNDDANYGGCTTRCSYGGFCGDGIVNGDEPCDDGPANVDVYGKPGCSFLCRPAGYCGDGILQSEGYEMCDQGVMNGQEGSMCSRDCLLPMSP
jgi:cysteine-rich repeat protein